MLLVDPCRETLDLNQIVEANPTYSGHIDAWGTKWGCYDVEVVEENDEYTKLFFHTAWCPYKKEVQIEMNSKFPNLKFKLLFAERGECFYGYYLSEYSEFMNQVYFKDFNGDCDIYKDDCDDNCCSIHSTVNECNSDCFEQCEIHEYYLKDPDYNRLYQTSG